MDYTQISFVHFERNYILKPGGYLPVYFSLDGDEEGLLPVPLRLDMVYPSRLMDGKVRFLEVPIGTPEEFRKAQEFLLAAHKELHDDLVLHLKDFNATGERLGLGL